MNEEMLSISLLFSLDTFLILFDIFHLPSEYSSIYYTEKREKWVLV